MRNLKKIIYTAVLSTECLIYISLPAAAVSESEVQAKVSEVGKEVVAGNVLIWFLCAIAFLKISQKIDSFMSSLGINVGHSGGSMLAEALIAARGIGMIGSITGQRIGGMHGKPYSGSSGNGGFLAGGLAGVASRKMTDSAIKTVTAPADASPSGIGGQIFNASVSKGGDFANGVIGRVATGSITSMGSITGGKAAQALHSYMGHAALEECAEDIPTFSNVEIGGGRITGTETNTEYPEGIEFGMYHTSQYQAPQGEYTTVQTVDGESWYKQYAVDSVERTPYMAPDGEIAYKENLVKRLPAMPRRKDRI